MLGGGDEEKPIHEVDLDGYWIGKYDYGITGNARSLSQYRYEVTRTWKKWLCRRSKRGHRLNWDRFNKLMDEFWN